MKVALAVVIVLVVAWLGLWMTGVGVLVYSADAGLNVLRDCRYLIGVSAVRRLTPLTERCPLIRKVDH